MLLEGTLIFLSVCNLKHFHMLISNFIEDYLKHLAIEAWKMTRRLECNETKELTTNYFSDCKHLQADCLQQCK